MKLRGNLLGMTISLAVGTIVAGCSSSSKSGTGGTGGGATGVGGATDAGPIDHPTGTGGTSAGDAGTGGASDGGAADVDAAPPPVCGPFADGGVPTNDAGVTPGTTTSFFVTSDTNLTGDLGGLAGADMRCQRLATAVGLGAKTWHAYLSTEHGAAGDGGGGPVNARERIGTGPWINVKGVTVATNLNDLHARHGDPSVFIDEHGNLINGQWTASPTPNEHDILTGSNADGTVAIGKTCADWTSSSGPPDGGTPDGGSLFVARVGHADGFGPACSTTPAPPNDVSSWNSAHDNAGCNDNRPRGGAGRLYCFAVAP
jgi:hypothetical protein